MLSLPKPCRTHWLLIAVALGWLEGRGQDQEEILELPPFVVTEQIQGSRWRYAQIDGFDILSQASTDETKQVVAALWRGRQMILPPSLLTPFSAPMVVVIFDQPPGKSAGVPSLGSVRGNNEETTHWTNLIKRRFGDRESFAINLWRTDFSFSNAFRFDTNTLLQRRAPSAPGWLREGLFGRYGLYREGWRWHPGDKRMVVPSAWWFSLAETDLAVRYYGIARQKAQFPGLHLPMPEEIDLLLLIPELRDVLEQRTAFSRRAAATPPPANAPPPKSSVAVADTIVLPKITVASDYPERLASTAALFVRWGIYGRTPEDTQKFWRFAERSCAEPVTTELFEECFGMSYERVRLELVHYLPTAVSEPASAPVGRLTPPAFKLRDATLEEIALVRGEWERMESAALAGRFPELAQQYREKARRTFAEAVGSGGHDPRLLASMGLLALDAGEASRARELLETAAAAKVAEPRVYYELAQLRWAKAAESKEKPSAALIEGVTGLLLTAEHQSPHLPGVYIFLAELALRSERCAPEHLAALQRGLAYFPRDITVGSRIAAALKR